MIIAAIVMFNLAIRLSVDGFRDLSEIASIAEGIVCAVGVEHAQGAHIWDLEL